MRGVAAQHGELLLPESLKGLHCLNCSISVALGLSKNQKLGCTNFFSGLINATSEVTRVVYRYQLNAEIFFVIE